MIIGIGNDIVSVTEIKESIKCSDRFLHRIFCISEQEYCNQKPNRFKHYAGCFAVKEAMMKALGIGWNHGVQWKHIELSHFLSGKPQVNVYYQAKERAKILQVKNIIVSLSYTEYYAMAVAILETGKN